MTDEQRKEAVERINKQEAGCLRMFKDLWGKRHPYDNTRRYLDVRIYLHGAIYELRHLRTLRFALEPKVVTIGEVRELLSCYRHVHSVDIYKLDEAQERAVIKKLAELGIAVKEDK